MGISGLWQSLASCNDSYNGGEEGGHHLILQGVEGKVIAVDLSTWLMQAMSQPALQDIPRGARCLKVVFERTLHWLRFGCLPVFVVEGRTPEAKLQRLKQRSEACRSEGSVSSFSQGNTLGGRFDSLGQHVREMLEAMGVPHIQAEGEGEAMCAALNACRLVDACQSSDVDALLFGAEVVYRQLHLETGIPKNCELVVCSMTRVRQLLGLRQGGQRALIAVAQLAGGDYDIKGADKVGELLALKAVRTLLSGCEDDQHVLDHLGGVLARGPDPQLDRLTKCTGCRTCRHDTGRKAACKDHGKAGCRACGTHGKEEGGSGLGGCISRPNSRCECPFHQTEDARLLNRVIRRATQTPGFLQSCSRAMENYLQQAQLARLAILRDQSRGEGRRFTWQHRPDVDQLICLLGPALKWSPAQVRTKLMPLLLEWDMRQGPSTKLPGSFLPLAIKKISQRGAVKAMEGDTSIWRYLLDVGWHPGGGQTAGPSGSRAWTQGEGDSELTSTAPAAASSSCEDDPGHQEVMERWCRDSSYAEGRSVRISLVAGLWGHLVDQWHVTLAGKEMRQKKGSQGNKAPLLGPSTPGRNVQSKMLDFFKQVKPRTRRDGDGGLRVSPPRPEGLAPEQTDLNSQQVVTEGCSPPPSQSCWGVRSLIRKNGTVGTSPSTPDNLTSKVRTGGAGCHRDDPPEASDPGSRPPGSWGTPPGNQGATSARPSDSAEPRPLGDRINLNTLKMRGRIDPEVHNTIGEEPSTSVQDCGPRMEAVPKYWDAHSGVLDEGTGLPSTDACRDGTEDERYCSELLHAVGGVRGLDEPNASNLLEHPGRPPWDMEAQNRSWATVPPYPASGPASGNVLSSSGMPKGLEQVVHPLLIPKDHGADAHPSLPSSSVAVNPSGGEVVDLTVDSPSDLREPGGDLGEPGGDLNSVDLPGCDRHVYHACLTTSPSAMMREGTSPRGLGESAADRYLVDGEDTGELQGDPVHSTSFVPAGGSSTWVRPAADGAAAVQPGSSPGCSAGRPQNPHSVHQPLIHSFYPLSPHKPRDHQTCLEEDCKEGDQDWGVEKMGSPSKKLKMQAATSSVMEVRITEYRRHLPDTGSPKVAEATIWAGTPRSPLTTGDPHKEYGDLGAPPAAHAAYPDRESPISVSSWAVSTPSLNISPLTDESNQPGTSPRAATTSPPEVQNVPPLGPMNGVRSIEFSPGLIDDAVGHDLPLPAAAHYPGRGGTRHIMHDLTEGSMRSPSMVSPSTSIDGSGGGVGLSPGISTSMLDAGQEVDGGRVDLIATPTSECPLKCDGALVIDLTNT